MIYTGIGARSTPGSILHAMVSIGTYMSNHGHILRSGGAQGADKAFETGCDFNRGHPPTHGLKEIYLPWKCFEQSKSPLYHVTDQAMEVAALFHPAWSNLKPGARKLMGRNAYQMLGLDLKTKTDMIICWTAGAKVSGGTGQSIRMAEFYDIPVFNLASASLNHMNEIILDFMETLQ